MTFRSHCSPPAGVTFVRDLSARVCKSYECTACSESETTAHRQRNGSRSLQGSSSLSTNAQEVECAVVGGGVGGRVYHADQKGVRCQSMRFIYSWFFISDCALSTGQSEEHAGVRLFVCISMPWWSCLKHLSNVFSEGGYTRLVNDGVYRTLRTSTVGVTESHVMEREPG